MDYNMEYSEAIDWLFSQLPMFSRVGAPAYKPGLDTSLALDRFFGSPHKQFKSIHIAGTNGKGSVSNMLAAILQAHGYKTGLYTSPHLADFRERIRINGEMISHEGVVDFVERFRQSNYPGSPSFFELTMMMAFDWFARNKVDYAIIEVGMGGRLDSTNIITPIGCVITNISADHTQFLGDTRAKIASEKAGIIKSGIPVVIGESDNEVGPVFSNKANEVGTSISFCDDETSHLKFSRIGLTDGWECTTPRGLKFSSPLAGDYQKANIRTALAAVDMMRKIGIEISDKDIQTGMSDIFALTGFTGRWTRLGTSPLVIADTGHNLAGLQSNMHRITELHKASGGNLRIVIGFVADKDVDHIVGMLPQDAVYYVTRANIPRAMDAHTLSEKLKAAKLIIHDVYDHVSDAFAASLADASTNDVVYVGGSTFVVADLIASTSKSD